MADFSLRGSDKEIICCTESCLRENKPRGYFPRLVGYPALVRSIGGLRAENLLEFVDLFSFLHDLEIMITML